MSTDNCLFDFVPEVLLSHQVAARTLSMIYRRVSVCNEYRYFFAGYLILIAGFAVITTRWLVSHSSSMRNTRLGVNSNVTPGELSAHNVRNLATYNYSPECDPPSQLQGGASPKLAPIDDIPIQSFLYVVSQSYNDL